MKNRMTNDEIRNQSGEPVVNDQSQTGTPTARGPKIGGNARRKTKIIILLCAGWLAATGLARAQADTNAADTNLVAEMTQYETALKSLKFQHGTISLRD